MITLITLLISLLGYGTPSDFSDFNESQLLDQIENAQAAETESADGGVLGSWEQE